MQGDGVMLFLVERSRVRSRVIEQWEIRVGRCHTCGRDGWVMRLAHARGYDKLSEERAELRCLHCAQAKLSELKNRGVVVRAEQELYRVVRDLERGDLS